MVPSSPSELFHFMLVWGIKVRMSCGHFVWANATSLSVFLMLYVFLKQQISSGPKQRGGKSEVAASPLPSLWSKSGQKCYVTPAFSGIRNAKRAAQKISSGDQQRETK